jgi:LPXTG-motif cell wall-anchored protein
LEAKESKTAVDTATTNLLAAINALVEAEDNSDKKDPADGTQNPSTGTQDPSKGNDSTTGNNNAATGTTNTATGNQTTNATNTGNTTNTDTTKTTGTTIRSNSPKTGDASVLNWLGLAIASVAAGGFTWRKKK